MLDGRAVAEKRGSDIVLQLSSDIAWLALSVTVYSLESVIVLFLALSVVSNPESSQGRSLTSGG